MLPKGKPQVPRKEVKDFIECDNCLMLFVNLGMHCFFSGGLRDYPPCGFTITPHKKESLSWEGVDFFPARCHWEQAAALPVYVSFSY